MLWLIVLTRLPKEQSKLETMLLRVQRRQRGISLRVLNPLEIRLLKEPRKQAIRSHRLPVESLILPNLLPTKLLRELRRPLAM
jgi:hypothetical protein